MPKIYIETNFSFPNLVKKYKKMEKKFSTDLHKGVAKTAKEMIKGSQLRPLAPSTKKIRKSGGFGIVPLYKTKELYKSIKGDSEGLHMRKYGKWHNDGDRRPEREFIKVDEKEQNKAIEKLIEGIDKALKK